MLVKAKLVKTKFFYKIERGKENEEFKKIERESGSKKFNDD